jgi:hypothetical protein
LSRQFSVAKITPVIKKTTVIDEKECLLLFLPVLEEGERHSNSTLTNQYSKMRYKWQTPDGSMPMTCRVDYVVISGRYF